MIQFILAFFRLRCSSTRVLELHVSSSWVENLKDLAERCQKSKAEVFEEAIALYEAALNTAHIEKSDDGLRMVIPLPREQSSTEVQQENQ